MTLWRRHPSKLIQYPAFLRGISRFKGFNVLNSSCNFSLIYIASASYILHLNDYHCLPSTTSACFPEFISTYSSTCTMHHHIPPLHATVHQCPPTNLLPLTPARLVTLHLQGICIITWNNNSRCRRKWFQTPIHPAVNPIPFQDFSLKNCFNGIIM